MKWCIFFIEKYRDSNVVVRIEIVCYAENEQLAQKEVDKRQKNQKVNSFRFAITYYAAEL